MTPIFWYKLHAIHGGGHQQESTEYQWSEYKFTDDEERERLIEWSTRFRNFRGEIEEVDKPPKEVLLTLLRDAKLRLAGAEHESKILEEQLWLVNNPSQEDPWT